MNFPDLGGGVWAPIALPSLYTVFLTICLLITDQDKLPLHVQQQAALQFKNLVKLNPQSWFSTSLHIRDRIKLQLLTIFEEGVNSFGGQSQCVHALGELELAKSSWAQLIPTLVKSALNPGSSKSKVRALECIGYICETVSPDQIQEHVNEMLTGLVSCVCCRESLEITVTALTALYNALEFCAPNFARIGERNYLMQVRLCLVFIKTFPFFTNSEID